MAIKYENTKSVNHSPYNYCRVISMIWSAFSIGYQKGYTDRTSEEINVMSNLINEFSFEENTSIELKDEYIYTIMETISKNSSMSSTEEFIMKLLPKVYNIINERGVYEFIEKNEFLNSFLIEAAQEIKKIFGENIEIKLVKETDPEISEYTKLVAYVNTSSWPMEKAIKYLDKFEDEWYIENMEREKGKFDIDVL